MNKFLPNKKGFTLIETIVYLFIASMLLMVIGGLVFNILNARKRIKSSNEIQNNARFILNFLNNEIHNVNLIEDVSPDPAQLYFYQLPDIRFSLSIEDNNLVYRKTVNSGTGWPEQSTATPLILNTSRVMVSNFILTPVDDNQGNTNQGAKISFTLTTGRPDDSFGYFQETFNTFFGLR